MSLIAELGQQMYIKSDAVSIVRYKTIQYFQITKLNVKILFNDLSNVFNRC